MARFARVRVDQPGVLAQRLKEHREACVASRLEVHRQATERVRQCIMEFTRQAVALPTGR